VTPTPSLARAPTSGDAAGRRIDQWLWFARITKSRTLAQKLVAAGTLRVNREKEEDPSRVVHPGDVLTLFVGGRVRVLKVLDAGSRRGPASEAALLYEDLAPRQAPGEPALGADRS